MSVASRILAILRNRALAASRALLDQVHPLHEASERDDEGSTAEAGPQPRSEHRGTGSAPSDATREPDLSTYYANLEIPYGAGLEEVKVAWKRQVRRYHPDRFASEPERQAVATELLKGINRAYTEICHHLESSEPS